MNGRTNLKTWLVMVVFFLGLVAGQVFAEANVPNELKSHVLIESDKSTYTGEEKNANRATEQNGQADWLFGKVEPLVEETSLTSEDVNVIVYVESPDLATLSNQIKASYKPQIEAITEQLRNIDTKYRPKTPIPPSQEKIALVAQQFLMTAQDQTQIRNLTSQLDSTLDEMRRAVGAEIKAAVQPTLNAVANFIVANGGNITAWVTTVPAIGATIPSTFLTTLSKHPLVVAITKDRPTEYELDVSIPSVDYDTWWTNGFDGGDYDFGIVDSGVQENHPAFSGITFYSEPGSSVGSDHGTHVTGIVASADITYRGGAYGLDAVIWANSGPGQSGTMDSMDWLASTAGQGPEVVNHSLGYGTADSTDYSNNDAFYDAFIQYYDIMVTKSAGNGGWDSSNPTITHPAPAYNLLAVANMDDKNTLSRSDDVRRYSSSVGPTLNGRKKPDVTAPGTDIMSTNSDWADAPDFISKTGTSMAAPHVAAAIVLMEDGGNYIPMAQKAVLINTADAWTSNNTETTSDDGAVAGSHWDKSYGWGYTNMWKAHFNRTDYFVDSVIPKNNNATPDDYKLYKGHMYTNEKATLVWQKRSNYIAGDPPSVQYSLSDLDITVYNENDGSSLDGDYDANDNVHQIAVDGSYDVVIKVYAYSSSFSGASSENYALATEEGFQNANPPSFAINLNLPSDVNTSENFVVTADVTNSGDVAAHSNLATLTLPSGFSIVSGANPQDIGKIDTGATGQATWTVHSSSTPGTYGISVSNSSSCYAETYLGEVYADCTVVANFARTFFVDADASGANNGQSWEDAYNYLQDAVTAASTSDEIWVAEGTYEPDANTAYPGGTGERTATFQLISGVAIYGGYAGYGAPDPNARDITLYETILTGDLDGNDTQGLDPCDLVNDPNRCENSYHVVTGSGTDANAILDGFTITAGNANDSIPYDRGGGMYNSSGSPTVSNCTFSYNNSYQYGAGMHNSGSSPILTNCIFVGNSTTTYSGGGLYNSSSNPTLTSCTFTGNSTPQSGGGMYNNDSSLVLTNCTFAGNTSGMSGAGMTNNNGSVPKLTGCNFNGNQAQQAGGGMASWQSIAVLKNCTFSGNLAEWHGGGMYNNLSSDANVSNCMFIGNTANRSGGGICNAGSNPTVTNSMFSGNSAEWDGGGIYNSGSDPNITNCTFSGNSAGAAYEGGGIYNSLSDPNVTNCIFWGNTDTSGSGESAQIHNDNSTPAVTYCCVQGWTGGLGGTGNIGDDPNFVDPNGPDGTAGTEDDNLRLTLDSPCIDAGDNNSVPADTTDLDNDGNTVEPIPWDLDGRPRFSDGDCNTSQIVDMGAYEFTYAYFGDFDGSCDVDFVDYAILANYWMTDEFLVDIAPTPAGNGIVDERDLDVLCDNWLFGK